MRTISWLGVAVGFFIVGASFWRWGIYYDDVFRLVVGLGLGVSIMAWSYLIDWMTMKQKSDVNTLKKFDSIIQDMHGMKELNNLK